MKGPKLTSLFRCGHKGPIRSFRQEPPAHYILRVQSFSKISGQSPSMLEPFGFFDAGGYRWRLVIYPAGNPVANSGGYISLYLVIVDTCSMIFGWEVDVIFRLFLYNHVRDQYLTLEEPSSVCFNDTTKQCGFARFIHLKTFHQASKGYLVDDECIIGAEVFVRNEKRKCRNESLSLIRSLNHINFTWIIENFSKMIQSPCSSKVFKADKFNWMIILHIAKNRPARCNSLSLSLLFTGSELLPSDGKVYASYTLRIVDQRHGLDFSREGRDWFAENESCGWKNFITLSEIANPEKGFLRRDKFIIEANISVVSTSVSS